MEKASSYTWEIKQHTRRARMLLGSNSASKPGKEADMYYSLVYKLVETNMNVLSINASIQNPDKIWTNSISHTPLPWKFALPLAFSVSKFRRSRNDLGIFKAG